MANTTTTTDNSRWASAKFNVSVADAAWDAVKGQTTCAARTKVADIAIAARENFYSTRAPDLGSVADKISIWFGKSLYGESLEMSWHRRVIGDLRRIALQAAGRTPEKAAQDAAEWRETLANYRYEEQLYLEGPSPRWNGRDAADILAVKDYLVGALLELPAPTLAGVILKLELLWEDHTFGTTSGGALLVELKRDLNSLIPSVEAEMARTD
ncbi:MAG: hypothetical protein WCY11_01820 [Novosphingobium sp.]